MYSLEYYVQVKIKHKNVATTISQAFSEFKSKLELSKSFQEKITVHHNAIMEGIIWRTISVLVQREMEFSRIKIS